MTITRLGQVTAETGSLGEISGTYASMPEISEDHAYTGIRSWRFGGGDGTSGLTFSPQSGIRGSFFCRTVSNTTNALYVYIGGLNGYALVVQSSNIGDVTHIDIYVNGVAQVISTPLSLWGAQAGVWFSIGFHIVSGAQGLVRLYINGTEAFAYDGIVNGDMVSAYCLGRFAALASGWSEAYLDDLYVDAITPDVEVGPPPSLRFLPSNISSVHQTQWTVRGAANSYLALRDPSGSDGDATHVQANVADLEELFNMSPISIPENYVVRAMIPTAITKKGDAALNAFLKTIIFDGVTSDISANKSPVLTYKALWNRYPLQPDGSVWTTGDLSAMKYGFISAGTFAT